MTILPTNPGHVQEVLRKFEADLRSQDFDTKHNALDVMSTTAPSYFHDEIFRLARDPDPFVAVHAVDGLERLNTSDARALLAEIITSRKADDPDEQNLRCGAIRALGHTRDASYLQMLSPYAEHSSTCESEFAMDAIAQLGRENAVPILQGFLQSPQSGQRLHAVDALPFTSSPDAVDALIGALRDKDEGVREKAATGLNELTRHSVSPSEQASPNPLELEGVWNAWWSKHRADTKVTEMTWRGLCRF